VQEVQGEVTATGDITGTGTVDYTSSVQVDATGATVSIVGDIGGQSVDYTYTYSYGGY
jgi:hypothetical protein